MIDSTDNFIENSYPLCTLKLTPGILDLLVVIFLEHESLN